MIDECTVGIHQQTFGRIIRFFLSYMQWDADIHGFSANFYYGYGRLRETLLNFFDKDRKTGVTVSNRIDLRKYHKNISIVNLF